ncbi:MAG: hypothetical protein LBF15_04615 [Candidatus Peribacteria bacterium]|nr:hypothetical protein [Candidatus Peribacteria bacterium]
MRFEYDTLNRIISETNGAETIKYSYDDNNNLISKLTPL